MNFITYKSINYTAHYLNPLSSVPLKVIALRLTVTVISIKTLGKVDCICIALKSVMTSRHDVMTPDQH